jgi:hypothetical protein
VDLYLLQGMEAETTEELQLLAEAVVEYYGDLEAFPASLTDLGAKPEGSTGWEGPYIEFEFSDAAGNYDDYRFDVWRQDYVLTVLSGTICTIRSPGPDRVDEGGAGDDIQVEIDVSVKKRETTLKELEQLNLAVDSYNRAFFPGTPLTGTLTDVIATLQANGYLPAGAQTAADLATDQWGSAYLLVGDPVLEVYGAP